MHLNSSKGLRCLDVYNISLDDGANICQWEYWNGVGQRFILEPITTVKGDVNSDGNLTVADVVMIQKYILRKDTLKDWKAADVYEDGMIDSFDLCLIKRLLVKR